MIALLQEEETMRNSTLKNLILVVSIISILVLLYFLSHINKPYGQSSMLQNLIKQSQPTNDEKDKPNYTSNPVEPTVPKPTEPTKQTEPEPEPEPLQPTKPTELLEPNSADNDSKESEEQNENLNNLYDNYLILVNKSNPISKGYNPPDLIQPKIPFNFSGDSPKKLMRLKAAQAIEKLFAKAKEENITLIAQSGYRSYQTQEAIFTYNQKRYGFEEANKVSAVAGQSEHQTGLAMDVSDPSLTPDPLVVAFGETKSGKWLAANAAHFGFIIRYPKGKEEITKYQYEPWHIRYVGVEPAKAIMENNLTLEEYLENINSNKN